MSDMFRAIDNCPKPVIGAHPRRGPWRRRGPRGGLRHRHRRRRCDLRLHRGEARHHSRGDLAVRAREDRSRRTRARSSSPASVSTRYARASRSPSCTKSFPSANSMRRSSVASRSCAAPDRRQLPRPSCSCGACSTMRTTIRAQSRRQAIARQRVSPEGQEGLRAFLERRRASFADDSATPHRQSWRDRSTRRARARANGRRSARSLLRGRRTRIPSASLWTTRAASVRRLQPNRI